MAGARCYALSAIKIELCAVTSALALWAAVGFGQSAALPAPQPRPATPLAAASLAPASSIEEQQVARQVVEIGRPRGGFAGQMSQRQELAARTQLRRKLAVQVYDSEARSSRMVLIFFSRSSTCCARPRGLPAWP